MSKKKRDDDLDTTTSFADMNVEGFRWYDPTLKKEGKRRKNKIKVTRKEYWAMVKGMILAVGPYVLIAILIFGLIFLGAYFWLK